MMYRTASVAAKSSVLTILAMVALAVAVGPHVFAPVSYTHLTLPTKA